MRTRVEVKGLRELEYALKKLGDEIAVKALRKAGSEAMKSVLEDMKMHAGYNALSNKEHMRDSIKIRTNSRINDAKTQTVVTVRVGPSKQHAAKARFQEFGTVKQIARPFIRPALDYNRQFVLNTLTEEIRNSIENYR
ncbi:HK97-gp10 family putative phage morphogenesis protein [Arsenophonus nasoniae]|uniref:HK97 gp10 family phage protein n=1 Tax=Arsenophonus nasoniae TaxID=638 RepID=A0AA95K5Y4_9GAMM|nr:HK97-gp10 family putative phage morphogenesis protein [Arsenophonus nasoniae]WGL93768.1 HK97 gp10 family phage protein [Arsenophonus nasoniae]WGL96020.1 HK97 gp10 family phage protein [Arsenophonus nasoniae]